MLRSSAGYRSSEWKLETRTKYRLEDVWRSHLDFEKFRSLAAEELAVFAERLMGDGIVEREEVLGSFYEDEPGEEGDDLVRT